MCQTSHLFGAFQLRKRVPQRAVGIEQVVFQEGFVLLLCLRFLFVRDQANLPILLENFTFNRKSDLDSYFNILETAEETFLKYAELEK